MTRRAVWAVWNVSSDFYSKLCPSHQSLLTWKRLDLTPAQLHTLRLFWNGSSYSMHDLDPESLAVHSFPQWEWSPHSLAFAEHHGHVSILAHISRCLVEKFLVCMSIFFSQIPSSQGQEHYSLQYLVPAWPVVSAQKVCERIKALRIALLVVSENLGYPILVIQRTRHTLSLHKLQQRGFNAVAGDMGEKGKS